MGLFAVLWSFAVVYVFFFKQKTAYEMRISDWSSDVCSSDLFNDSTVGSCDDVVVTQGTVTANGLTSNYEVLTPTSGGGNALVISLHWSNGNGASMANHMSMSELAKARNVTVVLPTADRKSTRLNSSH